MRFVMAVFGAIMLGLVALDSLARWGMEQVNRGRIHPRSYGWRAHVPAGGTGGVCAGHGLPGSCALLGRNLSVSERYQVRSTRWTNKPSRC